MKKQWKEGKRKNREAGWVHSENAKRKIGFASIRIWTGRKHTEETKRKMSIAAKKRFENPEERIKYIGENGPMFGKLPWNKDKKFPEFSEGNSSHWKGNNVGYYGLHQWVKKHLGHPRVCEHCDVAGNYETYSKQGKLVKRWNTHWANKSGEYKRELNDWLGLCHPCHMKFDHPDQT